VTTYIFSIRHSHLAGINLGKKFANAIDSPDRLADIRRHEQWGARKDVKNDTRSSTNNDRAQPVEFEYSLNKRDPNT
jgi:hypothetical protein